MKIFITFLTILFSISCFAIEPHFKNSDNEWNNTKKTQKSYLDDKHIEESKKLQELKNIDVFNYNIVSTFELKKSSHNKLFIDLKLKNITSNTIRLKFNRKKDVFIYKLKEDLTTYATKKYLTFNVNYPSTQNTTTFKDVSDSIVLVIPPNAEITIPYVLNDIKKGIYFIVFQNDSLGKNNSYYSSLYFKYFL